MFCPEALGRMSAPSCSQHPELHSWTIFWGCSSSSRPMTQHLQRCLCHPHTALCHPPWPSSSKCVRGYTEDRDNTEQCHASRLSVTSAEFLSLYEVTLCISWVGCFWTTLLLLQQNWLFFVSARKLFPNLLCKSKYIVLKISFKKRPIFVIFCKYRFYSNLNLILKYHEPFRRKECEIRSSGLYFFFILPPEI